MTQIYELRDKDCNLRAKLPPSAAITLISSGYGEWETFKYVSGHTQGFVFNRFFSIGIQNGMGMPIVEIFVHEGDHIDLPKAPVKG